MLALNSGSSSLKFGLYRVCAARVTRLLGGEAEGLGEARGALHAEDASGRSVPVEATPPASADDAIARIGKLLAASQAPAPQAIGHRIVHGGPALRAHCRIDAVVERELEAASAFAPLHTPAALAVIRGAQARFPGLPQVACFDTTFHRTMPDVAQVLALPLALRASGIGGVDADRGATGPGVRGAARTLRLGFAELGTSDRTRNERKTKRCRCLRHSSLTPRVTTHSSPRPLHCNAC